MACTRQFNTISVCTIWVSMFIFRRHLQLWTTKPSCRWRTRTTRKHAKNCSNSTCLQCCRWQYWSIFIRYLFSCCCVRKTQTDFMWCATRRRQHQLSKDNVTFAGSAIRPSSTVRDLGVMLDSKLSFGPHISQLVSRCFLQLRWIKSCVQALSMDVRKTV